MAYFEVDTTFYIKNKLASLQNNPETAAEWVGKTEEDLAKYFADNNVDAQAHFEQYGWKELLSANASFDVKAYLTAKANSLDLTVAQVIAAFEENGLNVVEHYEQYGKDEIARGDFEFNAGTSSLTEALANLQTAQKALADFQAEFEKAVDDEEATTADYLDEATQGVEDAILAGTDAVIDAAGLDNEDKLEADDWVGAGYANASPAVKAAMLSDAREVLAKALAAAEAEVAAIQKEVNAVKGLATLLTKLEGAEKSVELNTTNLIAAEAALAGKLAEFNTTAAAAAEAAEEEFTPFTEATELFAEDEKTGGYKFDTETEGAVTAKTPGAKALLDALNASVVAEAALVKSEEAVDTLGDAITEIEGDLLAGELAAAKALVSNPASIDEEGDVVEGEVLGLKEIIKLLEAAVLEQTQAEEYVATEEELQAAVTAAEEAFEALGYELPTPLTEAGTAAATANDDVFTVGELFSADEQTATILSFGLVGNDQLYIGTDFTLNTGALKDGDASVLEVFFIQTAAGTDVVLEQKPYGSAEEGVEEIVITLAGVNAADLTLTEDGFVTLA